MSLVPGSALGLLAKIIMAQHSRIPDEFSPDRPLRVERQRIDLGEFMRDAVRQIIWILDADLELLVDDRIIGYWDPNWLKEALWQITSVFLPRGEPKGSGTLRVQERNGWAQIELIIKGAPFTSGELADLMSRCMGDERNRRTHLARSLIDSVSTVCAIADAHGGTASVTSSQAATTSFTLTLPI